MKRLVQPGAVRDVKVKIVTEAAADQPRPEPPATTPNPQHPAGKT